jgi:hypothetical protein
LIAVKSTRGFFSFAVPQSEWNWPGSIYISVKLHVNERFLLRLINRGLELEKFGLAEPIGWLEVEGWVTKTELARSGFRGKTLPRGYQGESEWKVDNYIMHPLRLHRSRNEFEGLMEKYRNYVHEHGRSVS